MPVVGTSKHKGAGGGRLQQFDLNIIAFSRFRQSIFRSLFVTRFRSRLICVYVGFFQHKTTLNRSIKGVNLLSLKTSKAKTSLFLNPLNQQN